MKYLIIKVEETPLGVTRVYPVVFTERLVHEMVARRMIHCIGWDQPRGFQRPEVLSAGFCEVGNSRFFVTKHGSESLHMAENKDRVEDDEDILNMPDAMQGMIWWT